MLTIRWLNATPMYDLKKANLTTVRKRPESGFISIEKWESLLMAEHSTLRFLSLEVFDDDIPYTVACQLVRHTKDHCQPEMSSGRPDWNGGKERDYRQTRWYIEKFTPIGFIRMMEQRVCNKAEKPTRDWANKLIEVIKKHEDTHIASLAKFCKPRCKKIRCCPEEKGCGFYQTCKPDFFDN